MKDDLELCTSVGMDDVLSKPTNSDDLKTLLIKYFPKNDVTNSETSDKHISMIATDPAEPKPSDTTIDFDRIREIFENDENILIAIITSMIDAIPESLNKLKKSIDEQDAKEIYFHAHTIKGGLGNLHVEAIGDISAKIESKASAGDLSEIEDLYRQLELIIHTCLDEMKSYIKQSEVSP